MYLKAYAAGSLRLLSTARAIRARSCRRLDRQPGRRRGGTGAGNLDPRRLVRVKHAGVSNHASASCCTTLASLKSELVILRSVGFGRRWCDRRAKGLSAGRR